MMSRWRPPDSHSLGGYKPPQQRQWALIVLLAAILAAKPIAATPAARLSCKSFEKDEVRVECTSMQTHLIPHVLHPGLKSLKVTGSRISSLSNIDVYAQMRYLDLSQNSLTALGESLSKLHHLSVVIVRENKLTALRTSDLVGLRSLTRLDVSKNQIASIEARTFINSSLIDLDLSENRIRELTPAMVQGLSKLQSLNLKDNEFTTVPSALGLLRQLNYLDLSFNNIGNIPPNTLPDVKTLLLERCDLSNTSFLSNSSVTRLDLSANRFSVVPRPLPTKLEELVLDANPIQILQAKCLSHAPNLRNFSLSSCRELRSVHTEAFAGNSEIRAILLESDVSLKTLDSRMFRSLGKLEIVSLRESGLRTIGAGFVSWYLLSRVDLRDNPFKCDCSLSWLRDLALAYLNTTGEPANKRPRPLDDETVHISCAEPTKFSGRKLYELPASAFECGTSSLFLMITIPLVILILLGSTLIVVLFCWRHRLPTWLPCPRSKDKTAPTHNGGTKQQFLEKTYMMPGDDYDG
ncbi:protein slit-like [Tropilaelaps mercedesae]|uniref:Protein slit-like n=1 Tax=Tropilaelaps mercedesae TaxID=418985 RepID=A0A1V9Y3R4_9ACAR|nr:protein slit-like [Tropilaelaps mercedesae]